MKPIKKKRILAGPATDKVKKTIPILNEKGQTVYVTEAQLDVILERQRKGWEELRGLWEDKNDSYFDRR